MSPNPALLTWPRPVAAGGGPPVATFLTTATSASSAAEQTFSGLSIGSPSPTRTVIAFLTARKLGGPVVNSITIGGVAATVDVSTVNGWQYVGIARAVVPTGTTADVVVTFSTTIATQGLVLGLWSLDREVTTAATDTASGSPTSLSMTATAGLVIAAAGSANTSGHTWSGADESFDVSSPANTKGSGAIAQVDTGSLTITATLGGSPVDPAGAAVNYI